SEDILLNETENQGIEISNKKVEYHIMGMNPEEFPEHPQIANAPLFEVDSGALARMIDRTVIVSGAGDDRRAHISGVLMEILPSDEGPLFRLVATDGSRLSKVDYLLAQDVAPPEIPTIIIPKKGLSEVAKFLEVGGTVQLGIKNNNFIVKKANETIIVRLLEGEFPKYQEIIDKPDEAVPARLDKKAFQKTLRRMSILSSENYKGIIFKFDTDRLEIRANNPEIGESKEEIQIKYKGPLIEAAFNPRFFSETLSVIKGDEITINLTDSERPCLLEGQEDQYYLSVIMPMRI
ncbi:MAG: DNA polymerase III subunit beta, partial [Desulfosarcina sp.]|nr:DNA polymerase III subunit beta [Desulfobacterales bacterium]